MASRDFLKHTVSTSEPTASSLGDEWYNPTTDLLYKRTAVNGTTVGWVEVAQLKPNLNVTGIISGTALTSTGEISGTILTATNGIIVNNLIISNSYSIPEGNSAMSTGPITINNNVIVTIPSGGRWVVL